MGLHGCGGEEELAEGEEEGANLEEGHAGNCGWGFGVGGGGGGGSEEVAQCACQEPGEGGGEGDDGDVRGGGV